MDKYYEPGEQLEEYTIIKKIGEGRYGIVYLGENARSERFIIKQLKKAMLKDTKKKRFYEPKILKQLNDPRFPKFISKFNNQSSEGYVLEYIEGTVCEDLLAKENHLFSRPEIYHITNELIDILSLLHSNNIVHRDIRTPNVILKENNQLVLIDFGLARYINHQRYTVQTDYWYLGDFLINLYYTSCYQESDVEEKPWFEELDLNHKERTFLKKLMGIETPYADIEHLKKDFEDIYYTL